MMKNLKFNQIPFTQVHITDSFWKERMAVHQSVTVDACIQQCEITRVGNFEKVTNKNGNFEGIFFDDSDLYKVLEGAAYSLMHNRNPELEAKVDEIIDKIAAAQEESGYLMTYFTLEKPDEKWTDMDKHEMYCGGHLIEAAVAYYNSTGKRKLLDVACRLVDYFMSIFGPDKRMWIPGHEEIELALVKLYEHTQVNKYLEFSRWLIDNRGNGYGKEGDGAIFTHPTFKDDYYQHDIPVTDIEQVKGHAVRAMYLYAGMADVAKHMEDTNYIPALHRVWDNLVHKNMYITGGIGSSKENEGFTEDYDLPNDTAYAETCAGIGFFIWNWRMAQLESDSRYVDIMERTLYNNILAGWSLSGDKFFYVNPLEADGTHNRELWYGCACCPTNICRFIPSIGQYIYGVNDKHVVVNLYVDSEVITEYKGKKLTLTQKTVYPSNGLVTLVPTYEADEVIELKLRVPDWCHSYQLRVNGEIRQYDIIKGYVLLTCMSGNSIEFMMDMPVERMHANEKVSYDRGKVAIMRGPLVYAVEAQDQNKPLCEIRIPEDSIMSIKEASVGTYPSIECHQRDGELLAKFVPYFAWNNRGEKAMKVWVDEVKIESLYE